MVSKIGFILDNTFESQFNFQRSTTARRIEKCEISQFFKKIKVSLRSCLQVRMFQFYCSVITTPKLTGLFIFHRLWVSSSGVNWRVTHTAAFSSFGAEIAKTTLLSHLRPWFWLLALVLGWSLGHLSSLCGLCPYGL